MKKGIVFLFSAIVLLQGCVTAPKEPTENLNTLVIGHISLSEKSADGESHYVRSVEVFFESMTTGKAFSIVTDQNGYFYKVIEYAGEHKITSSRVERSKKAVSTKTHFEAGSNTTLTFPMVKLVEFQKNAVNNLGSMTISADFGELLLNDESYK